MCLYIRLPSGHPQGPVVRVDGLPPCLGRSQEAMPGSMEYGKGASCHGRDQQACVICILIFIPCPPSLLCPRYRPAIERVGFGMATWPRIGGGTSLLCANAAAARQCGLQMASGIVIVDARRTSSSFWEIDAGARLSSILISNIRSFYPFLPCTRPKKKDGKRRKKQQPKSVDMMVPAVFKVTPPPQQCSRPSTPCHHTNRTRPR